MKNKIAILSLFFLPLYAYTQVNNGFTNKLERYNRSHSSQGLYLHCDKTTYRVGDNIWFAGYQLKNLDTGQTVMFVALQNLSNDSVLSSDRFIMINGVSKGNLFLSNKLKQGNYRLTAFTNIQFDYPEKPVFQQLITVIGPQDGEYSLVNILTSPIPDRNGNYNITYKLLLRDGGSVNGGKFKYTLLTKSQVIQTGSLPLSELGEVTIPVHKDYGSTSLELAATIVRSKEEQFFALPLIVQDSLSIGLYPEGGNLIAGQKSKVALEITSNKNETGVVKGQILENGKPVTSFNTNKYGLGSFDLEPKFNAIYTVAIKDKPKFSYVFPEVLKQGVTMAVKNNNLPGDSAHVKICSSSANGSFDLVIHNYDNVYQSLRLSLNNHQSEAEVSLKNIPDGIAIVTLLNDSGDPVAERAIYINTQKEPKVKITADSLVYHTRSAIKIRVKVTDKNEQPVKSIFSIASVMSSKYDSLKVMSLPLYYYAGQYSPHPTILPSWSFTTGAENAELILLTKFWTRYNKYNSSLKNEVMAGDRISKGITLQTLYKEKKPIHPISLLVGSDSLNSKVVVTDSSGKICIPYESLNIDDGQIGVLPLPSGKYKDMLKFSITTNESAITQGVLNILNRTSTPQYIPQLYVKEDKVRSGLSEQNILKEVAIVASKKNEENEIMGRFVSKTCKDWVCMYNVLNCPNHSTGTKPVSGQEYLFIRPIYRGLQRPVYNTVVYIACIDTTRYNNNFLAKINAIHNSKEFYVADYKTYNPDFPETYSTVFWANQVITNDKGEAELNFSSNDLKGNCTIHLQGFSEKGPISGKCLFKVSDRAYED